jgi:hypothetical protein
MAQKVAKLGIKRDNNYLYYIKAGDVWQVPRKRPGARKGKASKAAAGGVTMESGFIYFLDKAGDIARVKAAVGGQKRKKTSKPVRRAATTKKAATKKTVAKKATTKGRTTAKAKPKTTRVKVKAKVKAKRR